MGIKKADRKKEFEGKGCAWTLENLPVRWVKLVQPDTMYEPCWSVDIIIPLPLKEPMMKCGFKIKEYYDKNEDGDKVPNGVFYLRPKKKVRNQNGEEQKSPWCRLEDGDNFDANEVGNGSICDIEMFSRYIKPPTGEQVSAWLNGITIKNLEPRNTVAKPIF